MTSTPTSTRTNDHLLATALQSNRLFSAASGATAVLGAAWLDGALGVPWPVLVGLGAGLVGFAGLLGLLLANLPERRRDVRLVVAADAAWVVGAIAVVALELLTPTGDIVLVSVTLVVALLTVAQVRGLRRE